jgi:hypothetical protein
MSTNEIYIGTYDFVGVKAYRDRHPEEPESSSGEWVRVDELKIALKAYLIRMVDSIV